MNDGQHFYNNVCFACVHAMCGCTKRFANATTNTNNGHKNAWSQKIDLKKTHKVLLSLSLSLFPFHSHILLSAFSYRPTKICDSKCVTISELVSMRGSTQFVDIFVRLNVISMVLAVHIFISFVFVYSATATNLLFEHLFRHFYYRLSFRSIKMPCTHVHGHSGILFSCCMFL